MDRIDAHRGQEPPDKTYDGGCIFPYAAVDPPCYRRIFTARPCTRGMVFLGIRSPHCKTIPLTNGIQRRYSPPEDRVPYGSRSFSINPNALSNPCDSCGDGLLGNRDTRH